MTHSTFRQAPFGSELEAQPQGRRQGGEGTRTAKLSFESEPEGSSLRVEDKVILWFDPSIKLRALRPSKGRLTTPRKIEGRRIEG